MCITGPAADRAITDLATQDPTFSMMLHDGLLSLTSRSSLHHSHTKKNKLACSLDSDKLYLVSRCCHKLQDTLPTPDPPLQLPSLNQDKLQTWLLKLMETQRLLPLPMGRSLSPLRRFRGKLVSGAGLSPSILTGKIWEARELQLKAFFFF